MAQSIACDMCGQENATFMQTNIANGDVVAVGDSCTLTFLLTVAAEIVTAMPIDAATQYGEAIMPVLGKLAGVVVHAAAESLPSDYDEDQETGDMVPVNTAVEIARD
jgi:hypothetical protein